VCEEGGVQPGEVYEVALAGNATMSTWSSAWTPSLSGRAFIMARRLSA